MEEAINEPKLGIKHPHPDEGDSHHGGDSRHIEEALEEGPHLGHAREEHEGQGQAHCQPQDGRDKGEEQGISQRLPKELIP